MTTSNTTRRDLIIAALMLLTAGLLYWFLQQGFYVDRLKAKGVGFSTNLKGEVTELRFTDPKFRDQDLRYIDSVSKLKVLDLKGSSVTEQGLSYLRDCQQLERLNLSETQVTDEGVREVSRIPNLSYLYLSDTAISDESLRYLASLTKLNWLDINGCQNITSDGLAPLGQLPTLKNLFFKGVPLTYKDFLAVQNKFANVKFSVDIDPELGLGERSPLEARVDRETGELSLFPRRFYPNMLPPDYVVTVPEDYVITAELLSGIPKKERVVRLSNDGELPVTHDAILSLRQFPNLRHLSLVCHIDKQTFQVIAGLSKLNYLGLELPSELNPDAERYEITQSDIASLAQLENLGSLSLTLAIADPKVFSALQSLPELFGLYLRRNSLTDNDILFLQNMNKLKWLSLRDNQLTDASLEFLEKLPNLLGVGLVGNSISLENLSKFSQRLRDRREAVKAAAIAEENQSSQDIDN